MKLPRRAPILATCLPLLTILLGGCAPGKPEPIAVINAAISAPTPSARKASIKKQIAAVCPTPLSDDDLERAALYVEVNHEKGAVWLVRRLSKMDAETRICRNLNH